MKKQIPLLTGFILSLLNKKLKLFLVLVAALLAGGMEAQVETTFTTTGDNSFTLPTGVASMTIECWGAGGSGGSAFNNTGKITRSAGGAGGNYTSITITSPTAGSYICTVGAGGIAPALTSSSVNAVQETQHGGASSFKPLGGSDLVVANGGFGGLNAVNNTGDKAKNAAQGDNSNILGSTGTIFWRGGRGASATSTIGTVGTVGYIVGGAGGGGGGAGSTADGGAGGTTDKGLIAGTGGALDGGNGGAGAFNNSTADGSSGSIYGGGGGGACVASIDGINKLGGAGANGKIKITYTLGEPTQLINAVYINESNLVELKGTKLYLKNQNVYLSIFDITGKQIFNGKQKNEFTFERQGLYIVKAQLDGKVESFKISINK